MAQRHARNLVAAGLFLVLMGAAAVALLVLVGGRSLWFEKANEVHVRFTEAPNVKPGSPVLLAGQPVGRVRRVAAVETPCPPPHENVLCYAADVVLGLPADLKLWKNASVVIGQSLVGQSATVSIESVGTEGEIEGFLVGGQESPFSAAFGELGIGPPEKKNIQEILANLRDLSQSIKESLPAILDKVKVTAANFEKLSTDAKDTLPQMRENLVATSQNLKETSEQAKATLAKLDEVVNENRDDIRQAVANTRSLTEKADKTGGEILDKAGTLVGKIDKDLDQVMANVTSASADMKTAMADLKRVAADSKTLLVTNKENVDRTAMNLRVTSEHLKAVAEEVRRAPWRLLAKPDKKDVETLNLYDSARAFATAASDLEAFSDTLRMMMNAKEAGIEVDPEIVKGMMDRLDETFKKYQDAEDALWKEFDRLKH